MGYAQGVNNHGREIGYAVRGVCDHDGCHTEIALGVAACCGEADGHGNADVPGEPYCGRYFCDAHLTIIASAGEFDEALTVCEACAERQTCPACQGTCATPGGLVVELDDGRAIDRRRRRLPGLRHPRPGHPTRRAASVSLLDRVRRGVRQARVSLWATPETRHALRVGYLAALDDVERADQPRRQEPQRRGGLRPRDPPSRQPSIHGRLRCLT